MVRFGKLGLVFNSQTHIFYLLCYRNCIKNYVVLILVFIEKSTLIKPYRKNPKQNCLSFTIEAHGGTKGRFSGIQKCNFMEIQDYEKSCLHDYQ